MRYFSILCQFWHNYYLIRNGTIATDRVFSTMRRQTPRRHRSVLIASGLLGRKRLPVSGATRSFAAAQAEHGFGTRFRHIMDRKVLTGCRRTRRRIGRQTNHRHIGQRYRATRQHNGQQRSTGDNRPPSCAIIAG